ncbi:MAG: hypothetical protein WBS22_00730 [Methylocystis sp.]
MRFLGIGDYCDLSSLYVRLQDAGHEVRVFISEPMCKSSLAGIVPHAENWEAALPWVREAGEDGIILFENVAEGCGRLQDSLRAASFHVIGGSAFGDRLENDRAYGQQILREIGLQVAPTFEFDSPGEAIEHIKARPARYVLKFNGSELSAVDNYVGKMRDGADVAAMIRSKFRQEEYERFSFVLMDHVEGVEMGVGAYFNGTRFLEPACLDWEHKAFFPGDLGELTGEMGTVATFERTGVFFHKTLARMGPLLAANGYCGYINLNTIVNEAGIWPLEFTCRFGYPGYAVLEPLQKTTWPELFKALIQKSSAQLATHPGFSVGVVLTTPPFPYVRSFVPEPIGLPILFDGALSATDFAHLHLGEVGRENGQLVTAGYHGWTMVVTGVGSSIERARRAAYERAGHVIIPKLRYRIDIGEKLSESGYAEVERLGLFGDA